MLTLFITYNVLALCLFNKEQNKKKPFRIDDDYDEKEKKLEIENQMIKYAILWDRRIRRTYKKNPIVFFFRSRLKYLEENIKSETEDLNKREKELVDIREQVVKATFESTRHINAYNKFSTIQMEKICNEMQELQQMLTKLQTEECAKSVVKKSVWIRTHKRIQNTLFIETLIIAKCDWIQAGEYLTSKIESIHRNLEKCRLEAITFLDQPNERLN